MKYANLFRLMERKLFKTTTTGYSDQSLSDRLMKYRSDGQMENFTWNAPAEWRRCFLSGCRRFPLFCVGFMKNMK